MIENDVKNLTLTLIEGRLRGFIADRFDGVRAEYLIAALMAILADLVVSDGASKKEAVAVFATFMDALEEGTS